MIGQYSSTITTSTQTFHGRVGTRRLSLAGSILASYWFSLSQIVSELFVLLFYFSYQYDNLIFLNDALQKLGSLHTR